MEIEREAGGRWLADVGALPGCAAYGATPGEALAPRVLADRLEHGEWPEGPG